MCGSWWLDKSPAVPLWCTRMQGSSVDSTLQLHPTGREGNRKKGCSLGIPFSMAGTSFTQCPFSELPLCGRKWTRSWTCCRTLENVSSHWVYLVLWSTEITIEVSQSICSEVPLSWRQCFLLGNQSRRGVANGEWWVCTFESRNTLRLKLHHFLFPCFPPHLLLILLCCLSNSVPLFTSTFLIFTYVYIILNAYIQPVQSV